MGLVKKTKALNKALVPSVSGVSLRLPPLPLREFCLQGVCFPSPAKQIDFTERAASHQATFLLLREGPPLSPSGCSWEESRKAGSCQSCRETPWKGILVDDSVWN